MDNGGNVLYDLQEADLRIWITDGSGETLYEETQHVMVSSGAMSVMVGDGNDSTETATGGVPYDAMTPDGEKRLNFQIIGDSIPQEELELGSVPYSYYSQYAIDLPTDTVTTDHILNGTITQDDFSQELIDYIDSSMTGISEQDLIDHQNEDGAHTARSVSLENTFVNISGTNVQEAFENVDHALNIRTTDIDGLETDVTDLQTQITQEISDRQVGDTTLQQNIDNEATTRANADSTLQSNIDAEESAREAADTALDGRVGTLESTATSLQNQITQEISDRQAGDATLQQNIDNHINATSAHGVSGNIVGDSDSQSLTNKTLDDSNSISGTAINSGTVDESYIDDDIARDSELSSAMAGMPPIGTIIPFYDFGGALTFDSSHWTYCDGSTAAISGIGTQTLPDLSNRYLVGFGTEGGNDIDSATWDTSVVGNASHQVDLSHTHTGPSHSHTISATTFNHTHDVEEDSGLYARIAVNVDGVDGIAYDEVGNPSDGIAVADWTSYDRDDAGGDENGGQNMTHGVRVMGTTGGVTGTSSRSTGSGGTGSTGSALSSAQSIQPRSVRVRFIMRVQ